MKVIVCGGRDYDNTRVFFREMDRLHRDFGPFAEIIHGGAKGADTLAGNWSLSRLKKLATVVPVRADDWSNIKAPGAIVKETPNGTKYNAAAGPARNEKMLREHWPAYVLAFPGGDGTQNMIDLARDAGKLVEGGLIVKVFRIGEKK